jgi:hypothetical protein
MFVRLTLAIVLVVVLVPVLDWAGFDYDNADDYEDDPSRVCRIHTGMGRGDDEG